MAVAGIGIERDVADDPKLRHFALDGADRSANEIVRLDRLAARLVPKRGLGIRKQGDRRNRELGGALDLPHRLVHRQALDSRHGVDRRPGPAALDHE